MPLISRNSPAEIAAPQTNGTGLVLGAGRDSGVVEFDRQVVDFFVSAADLLGVPKSVAAIYGTVFASAQALSFAQIEARLDISKGSVSQGLRVLREMGALKVVSTPADRVERYAPDLELRKLVARFLENRLQKQLDAGGTRLAALRQSVPAASAAEEAEIERRLRALSDWHSKAKALLPLARTVLKVT